MSESCRQLKYLNEGENMVYGYIRVSTDKQTVENQRYEINAFAVKEKIEISAWFEETISGCKDYETRKLGKLLSKMKPGDIMICTELSRLGRSLFMIMSILNLCMKQNVRVWTIKDNYRLGEDIASVVISVQKFWHLPLDFRLKLSAILFPSEQKKRWHVKRQRE